MPPWVRATLGAMIARDVLVHAVGFAAFSIGLTLCALASAEETPSDIEIATRPAPEVLPPSSDEPTGDAPVAPVHTKPTGKPFGFADRPLSLNGAMGFGTPVGLAGAILEYSPLPWFAAGAGAGTNFEGLQLAALVRVRPIYWETQKDAFGIGLFAAFAGGPFTSDDDLDVADFMGDGHETQFSRLDHALWFQPELQFEWTRSSGFHLVATGLGFAYLLNGDDQRCVEYKTRAPVQCDPAKANFVARRFPTFML
jgi:hypothetical protein